MPQKYTMTAEEVQRIKDAGRPVAYMIFGGMEPTSPAENQMNEWKKIADKYKCKVMTIVPDTHAAVFNEQNFLAEPLEEDDAKTT